MKAQMDCVSPGPDFVWISVAIAAMTCVASETSR
jgi:hypothetical protein